MTSDLTFPTLVHEGRYGPFEGAVHDRVVFGHYREHGSWSPQVLELLLQRTAGQPCTLLDVGANIGLVSIPFAARSRGHVYAFEPAPQNFELLRRNVERHGLGDRISLFEVAAHERPDTVGMRLSADNHGDHQVVLDGDVSTVEVRAERLDTLLHATPLQGHVVMKVDTQGCEVRALRGAQSILPQVDTLVVEYWPLGLQRMGDSMRDLNTLLSQFPYACILSQTGEVPVLGDSARLLDSLNTVLSHGDPGFFDILLCRAR